MERYFKIIGTSSQFISFISEDFKVGVIYKESIESDDSKSPALIGDSGEFYWVSYENIQEVTEYEYLNQIK